MNSSAKNNFGSRRLPVQWLDAPAVGPWMICRRKRRRYLVGTPRCGVRTAQRAVPTFSVRHLRAFTLLELMLVITIIGFIAGMTLSHIGNFGQANSMTSATRQLLDDVALARQRAIVSRSTVYMVFLPPMFWTNTAYASVAYSQQETNLMMHQYGAYALVSLSTVGDQPGQHHARYLTDWRFLPSGVFLSPLEFTNPVNLSIYTTNTLSGLINTCVLQPWNTVYAPFPSLFTSNTTAIPLPCIAFTPQGSLTTQYPQYIALARGSAFYPTDTNGVPLELPPSVVETPPGNDMDNPNLIQIDWLTGRATLMQNQMQ
jgi:prepilin-type N-terminal cleavage/methylation domain-containing protein